jgi:hypothetical protein
VQGYNAAIDAFEAGDDQEAARLLAMAGVDVGLTGIIVGGWRVRYKDVRNRIDARNAMVEEARAAAARNVTPQPPPAPGMLPRTSPSVPVTQPTPAAPPAPAAPSVVAPLATATSAGRAATTPAPVTPTTQIQPEPLTIPKPVAESGRRTLADDARQAAIPEQQAAQQRQMEAQTKRAELERQIIETAPPAIRQRMTESLAERRQSGIDALRARSPIDVQQQIAKAKAGRQ